MLNYYEVLKLECSSENRVGALEPPQRSFTE